MLNILRNYLISRTRNQKTFLMVLSDVLALNIIFIAANIHKASFEINPAINYFNDYPIISTLSNFSLLPIILVNILSIGLIYLFDGYKSFFRSNPAKSFIGIERFFGTLAYCLSFTLLIYSYNLNLSLSISIGLFLITQITFFLVIIRTLAYSTLSGHSYSNQVPILLYGAGQAGRETAAFLSQKENYKVLGFIDDDKRLNKFHILGLKVLGGIKKIPKIKKKYPNLMVVISILSKKSRVRADIVSKLEKYEVNVKTIPSDYDKFKSKLTLENLDINDLLNREPSENKENKKDSFLNKRILVTGAGGSIGSVLAEKLLKLSPEKIIFVDFSEFNLYDLELKLDSFLLKTKCKFLLRDIQNIEDIEKIIDEEDINSIYHAAAYKHVPLLQSVKNYSMALKNNFFCTYSLCELAYKKKIKNFTLISTDKAVNPTNIMGASKRLSELALQAFQEENGNKTCFSIVRFGNVLNSSGSVVPLFWDQISNGGPVTVTDEDITRYFMTLDEAATLVLEASLLSKGGEVFLLDMGEPIKIIWLAEKMIRLSGNSIKSKNNTEGIEIKFTGLRPGEKLYEELLLSGDFYDTENPKIKKGIENSYGLPKISKLKDSIEHLIESTDIERINKEISLFVEGYK